MSNEYIVYSINRTKKKIGAFIESKLKEEGVDDIVPAYSNILTTICLNNGKIKMSEIGRKVCKDKSTITVLVNRLIDKGYLQKEKCETDKRVILISLTDKALEFKESFVRIKNEVRNVAYTGFSESEKEVFMEMLIRINSNFEENL